MTRRPGDTAPQARTDASRKADIKSLQPPLMLLPMALEYRLVDAKAGLRIRDTSALRADLNEIHKNAEKFETPEEQQKAYEAALEAHRELPTKEHASDHAMELWFRWYPDENFAENDVPSPSEAEKTARDTFRAAIGGANWWDLDAMATNTAWQAFVQTVGAARAVHLVRTTGQTGAVKARQGRICALPCQVRLYALVGGHIRHLGDGKSISPADTLSPKSIAYTPDAADPSGWLVDFAAAVDAGMGLVITDPTTINLAREATWIIAVGLNDQPAQSEVEALVSSHIANGDFGFLPQDTPTNNTPDTMSYRSRPERDVAGFTAKATSSEQGLFARQSGTAADLMAQALDIPQAMLRDALDAADSGLEDAKAMLRAIGPVLLDDSLQNIPSLKGVSEDSFLEVLAEAFVARGALPAMRFGNNAYGIAPITDLEKLEIARIDKEDPRGRVQDFLLKYALEARAFYRTAIVGPSAVITPNDENAPAKLFQMLSLTSASKRIDLSDPAAGAETSGLACPYVAGDAKDYQPDIYLERLTEEPASKLPVPDASNLRWPLLYRLVRMSLSHNTKRLLRRTLSQNGLKFSDEQLREFDDLLDGASLTALTAEDEKALDALRKTDLSDNALDEMQATLTRFATALTHLASVAARPEGFAELEMLLVEVIDLMQHRADAFPLGLAYLRLKTLRDRGVPGLAGGYYGVLRKLRGPESSEKDNGFVQAPSTPQAVTAALLRSAYVRHGAAGPFAVNLSSTRVRRALQLLDLLSKGHDLQEALGMRGERWLHDHKLDVEILNLRRDFALTRDSDSKIEVRRVFNGLTFLEKSQSSNDLRDLQTQLRDDLDALADIVMAEAVHQRALGQAGAANAWLAVMSGHPPPGRPTVLRTQRHGHGTDHRVALMFAAATAPQDASPRVVAEPSLATFVADQMPGFDHFAVTLTSPNGPDMTVALEADLQMAPIDLVIGGLGELELRAKSHLNERISADPELAKLYGAPGGEQLTFQIALDDSSAALASGLTRAEHIRKIALNGRPLAASDLNAAAPSGPLAEAATIAHLQITLTDLRQRVLQLAEDLDDAITSYDAARLSFQTAVQELDRIAQDGGPGRDQAMKSAETARQALVAELSHIAVYGQPDALRPLSVAAALNDPIAVFGQLSDRVERLRNRASILQQALSVHAASGHTNAADVNAAIAACVAALKSALDGDGMIILPHAPRNLSGLRPAVGDAMPAQDSLGSFAPHREALRRLRGFLDIAVLKNMSGFVTTAAASRDPQNPSSDTRDTGRAPRVTHNSAFLSPAALMQDTSPIAGIMCDEWTVQRPSNTQMAGIAVNYDSPKAQAPNCILLGIPPTDDSKPWTPDSALQTVLETLEWMRIRSLSSDHRLLPLAQFPGANYVGPVPGSGEKLIPEQKPYSAITAPESGGLDIIARPLTGHTALRNQAAANLAERRGFTRTRE